MTSMFARFLVFASLLGLLLAAPQARADAVDDAFTKGTDAASRNDWPAAVDAFESASALLPERSAVLSYNLGTAYAHVGDLGRATYHLQRATDWRAGPTAEILEAARSNLAAVRRRTELDATGSGAKIDRPETTWDLLVDAIAAPWVAWLTLLSGVAFVVVFFVHRRWLREQSRRRAASRVFLIGAGVLYLVPGLLHAWSVRVATAQPEAIVLGTTIDAREGPGQHRPVAFPIQGGARVRVLEHSPGWTHIKLPGGLKGWVSDRSIADLDAVRAVGPSRASQTAGQGDDAS